MIGRTRGVARRAHVNRRRRHRFHRRPIGRDGRRRASAWCPVRAVRGRMFRVGVDLTTEQFWTGCCAGRTDPVHGGPIARTFKETFEACFTDGADAIVCPSIGSKLSGTFRVRRSRAGAARPRDPRDRHRLDLDVHRHPALLAAEMSAAGMPAAEIAAAVSTGWATSTCTSRSTCSTTSGRAAGCPRRRRRSGRCSRSSRSSRCATGSSSRRSAATRAKARARTIELIAEAPIERLAIIHTPTSTADEVAAFRDRSSPAIPGGIDPAAVSTGLLGASHGPHLGPT